MEPPTLPLHTQLLQMASGYWLSQCIYVAAKLAIADHLKAGEQPCRALAHLTETDETALYRILRALASVGIFQETASQTFALTPLADFLRSDHPRSMRGSVVMLGNQSITKPGVIFSTALKPVNLPLTIAMARGCLNISAIIQKRRRFLKRR